MWQREAVCSTGLGHGFAIPHCKTDALLSDSLVVLRLDPPVDWGSLDGEAVRVVLLLAVRESDPATAHKEALATLTHRLMHEEFRSRLAEDTDAESLCQFLAEMLRRAVRRHEVTQWPCPGVPTLRRRVRPAPV